MPNYGYATEEERIAARRETWRKSKERRYLHYKELCKEAGVSTQQNWQAHYFNLRPAVQPFEKENARLIRRQRSPYARWWLERFSVSDIVTLAGQLEGMRP